MRPSLLLALLAACQSPAESDPDAPGADTDIAETHDTDVPAPPFGLPPVDDACRARFPAGRPDDLTLARLVGTWTGYNGSGGTTSLTLGADGRYSWVSDADDYDLRDESGTWSAFASGERSALVLGADAVVPFRLDGDALVVENLDVAPGDLRLTGGAGAATAPLLGAPAPTTAWCAATGSSWQPTYPWSEQRKPDTVELRTDGSVAASWVGGCLGEGGGWAVWHDDPSLPPRLEWWVTAPCPEGGGSWWVGDLDLSAGWIGRDGDTWWPSSGSSDTAVVDGTSPTFRLFGTAPRTAQVGVPFTLDLTLRHRRGSSPVVDRARLVLRTSEDSTTDLAVTELGGIDLNADDVLSDNDETPLRLTWSPTAAQAGRVALQVRIDWRPYGGEEFATFDVPLALWVNVAPAR